MDQKQGAGRATAYQFHIDEIEAVRRPGVFLPPHVGHVTPVVRAILRVRRDRRVVDEAVDAMAIQHRAEVVERRLARRVPAQVHRLGHGRRRDRRGYQGEEQAGPFGLPHGLELLKDELCGEGEAKDDDEPGGPVRARDGTTRNAWGAHPYFFSLSNSREELRRSLVGGCPRRMRIGIDSVGCSPLVN